MGAALSDAAHVGLRAAFAAMSRKHRPMRDRFSTWYPCRFTPYGFLVEMNLATKTPSLILLFATVAAAEAVRFDLEVREDVLGGRSWSLAGAYERLAGRIHFEVDPQNSANRIIRDINYAPLNATGRIEFSADFYLLKPKDIGAGNGTVLLDVMNRSRKRVLRYFNATAATNDPRTEADFGDGFLMRQGFTLLYVGWQFDCPISRA